MKSTMSKADGGEGGEITTMNQEATDQLAKSDSGSQKPGRRISIKQEKDEPTEVTFSKYLLKPNINTVTTISMYQPLSNGADLTAMMGELTAQAERVQAGDLSEKEALLHAQSLALDNMFHYMAQKAVENMQKGCLGPADTMMRMALKAQSQCRTTIEALAELKYPKSATFIKQANIANQQQVNNGQAGHAAPAAQSDSHGKNVTPKSNELLEVSNGERLEFGATRAASRANSGVETVESINRAKD